MKNPTEPASPATPTPPTSIAEAIPPVVDRGLIVGAVVPAATKDRVLALDAYGHADLAALMMLVDEGKVSVDDPVEKYLPEFAGQMAGEDTRAETPALTLKKRNLDSVPSVAS